MIGIGKAPYWYISQDNDGGSLSEPAWTRSGSDPSYPYTWPTSVGCDAEQSNHRVIAKSAKSIKPS
jgi:hypothetical protein